MPTETAQTPASQTRTCPECGLSGFASLQGLSVHMRRVHGAVVMPRPAERAEANAREVSTPPARAEREDSPENSPAVKEIHCPACESKVSSDGITVLKKSPNLVAFEEAEIGYSDLEAERDQLAERCARLQEAEIDRLVEEINKLGEARSDNEDPLAKIKRRRAENEKLAKQIRELGEEPVTQRRLRGMPTPHSVHEAEAVAITGEHGRKLAEQLKKIQALKKVGDQNEDPKAKIERLRAENENLAKQIRELGKKPVEEKRRKRRPWIEPSIPQQLAAVEEDGRKLAEQLKEIQAQAREPEGAGSRKGTNEKAKSRTARG